MPWGCRPARLLPLTPEPLTWAPAPGKVSRCRAGRGGAAEPSSQCLFWEGPGAAQALRRLAPPAPWLLSVFS